MDKNRLEAFSDGVFAIIITIMVLEIKIPHGEDFSSLIPLLPVFLSYVLSFLYIGIYWNNHHHLIKASHLVNGSVLWANLHLLFWLSLLPFATGWMGENHFASAPLVVYGIILFMASIAYWLLQNCLIKVNGKNDFLSKTIGNDIKGKMSPFFYLMGILSAFWKPWVSELFYLIIALIWLIPDKRIEKNLEKSLHDNDNKP